ncbi:MAG TPA: MBL fold metallo-hydrolase [Bacteroidetes bacterium]|nr:putative metallo-hydrolase YycJ [bacterium BMS3Bbin04]HDO64487.1 MBL fold metallo-hydrolase [Bacteroidota bacterium]HEX03612.1 MBL fold metallo-hydrolase [Bacteroidota bacterium]
MQAIDNGIAVCPLGSGSKGNAYWIETASTAILVDAGFSFKQLCKRISDIGRDIADVRHIFLTHEHADHVQSLSVMLKCYHPTIWASGGTLKALRQALPEQVSVRRLNGSIEDCEGIAVQAIPIAHDAAEPLAYRFAFSGGSVAVVTDLGEWTPDLLDLLAGPDILVCEANHDPEMLEDGPYPWHIKKRIKSEVGHLSNKQGAELAAAMVKKGTRSVILAHLSTTNNDANLALDVFGEELNGPGSNVEIQAASQDQPGPWMRSVPTVKRERSGPSIASLLRKSR